MHNVLPVRLCVHPFNKQGLAPHKSEFGLASKSLLVPGIQVWALYLFLIPVYLSGFCDCGVLAVRCPIKHAVIGSLGSHALALRLLPEY